MFDELILLLDTSEYAHVSAVIIQETHWKHESTWRASGWSCVHSGCESESYTGILIMVRGKLVPHDLIRYDVVKPGRLLHVRIPFGPQLQDRSLEHNCWRLVRASGSNWMWFCGGCLHAISCLYAET